MSEIIWQDDHISIKSITLERAPQRLCMRPLWMSYLPYIVAFKNLRFSRREINRLCRFLSEKLTEYVNFSLTILVWELVWGVFSVTILVDFSEKSTNLVCSYCWECHSWQFHQILQELSFSNREFYRSCHIQFRFVDFSPSTIFVTQFLSLLPRIVILSLSNEKSTILVIDKSCRLF